MAAKKRTEPKAEPKEEVRTPGAVSIKLSAHVVGLARRISGYTEKPIAKIIEDLVLEPLERMEAEIVERRSKELKEKRG